MLDVLNRFTARDNPGDNPGDHPRVRRGRRAALVPLLAVGLVVPMVATTAEAHGRGPRDPAPVPAECPWMNTRLSPEDRAELLIDASSQHQLYRWLVEQPANNPTQTVFSGVEYPAQLPCTPKVTYADGPEGVRAGQGLTAFGSNIMLAATWDHDLAEDKGQAMGDEAFDKQRNGLLAPGIASGRTPLSGRTPEYLGEDSLLSGLLAARVVDGIQDDRDGKSVMAELKHFVANEQELDRQTSSSNLDERTLREVYALPYEIALSESDPANIMCAFNQINGQYACENDHVLNDILKDAWDYGGYVVSDFGAVHSTADALNNGLDQELNRPRFFTPALLDQALAAGDITQARIEDAAKRVLTAYIDKGLFDHPMPDVAVEDASTAAHKATALQIAQEGAVLLKNDRSALPLQVRRGQTIALIGPTASATPNAAGVSARSVCTMSFRGNPTQPCEDLVTPEAGLAERAARAGATVVVDDGSDPAAAAALAASADVAVVLGYQLAGEFADLTDLHLHGGGDALVDAVASANSNTVVVLQTGSAVEMPWLSKVRAVVEAWYTGEQMGPAIASVLFGDVNPSGKLPMTFPRSLADTPTAGSTAQYPGIFSDGSTTRPAGTNEIRQVDYAEGLEVGYRWYQQNDIDPLFEFGHGLSYTSFRYDRLKVVTKGADAANGVSIRFQLTNTGRRTGTETAQAYVTLPAAADEPGSRLVGWEKVTLKPGQSRWVTISLSRSDLADHHLLQYWDTDDEGWTTAAGRYDVAVGGSSDTSVGTSFTVRTHGHGHWHHR
ncbi:glycoside hydrolase family 3 C-terminal domain-containing protein [Cellulomonas sp. DKR-3]|uniref:Glycoside hydrolase family 3 C-terminal domain-containing protein n=1 Tax=Cellulomonas fulva TaxID=2835530 RepID=A0ABS5TXK2_9CELL|nr:glycoside hydrolase family 3 C-terminal domain-containing protein [Cellulomonas fulva]MBT0993845.1 glycoside hydrolase family 3 C-terminal domain-containing protein [Cellulomonas fulva]